MEEEKAAAYYDELTRKGEGAARFKQGLGYSSASSAVADGSGRWKSSSSSSLLSSFVRASSKSESEAAREAQLTNIKAKLSGKSSTYGDFTDGFPRRGREERGTGRRCGGSVEGRPRAGRDRSRSRSLSPRRMRSGRGDSSESGGRRRSGRSRSRSRSRSPRHKRSEWRRSRSRSRSSPPPLRRMRSERRNQVGPDSCKSRFTSSHKEKGGAVDYSLLIEGYDRMTAAERVKAKMKLQLSQTAAKDTVKGKGWERFEFDKDAPLDDEEIEVADDDAKLVKDMGRTFQFSAIEAKQEADREAAHDQAIFGVPLATPVVTGNECAEDNRKEDTADTSNKSNINLMSEKVLVVQQGSWRDRVRKLQKE